MSEIFDLILRIVVALLQLVDAILRMLSPLGYCRDMRGFLKYGGSYWLRMRRLEAWRSKREMI
ncbi:hypothetical protein HOY34_11725 [Xinfangfangia sp. D13-10-4-6]|uniref:hypothetical protein n=1 Tax=Pseudogemmobacter hezensis TaxID=2737662 RepID=UPI001554C73C|nr:hypothetical protein [Pseudogemmobacter hezensis]NPD15866.1 hypothetical protein [Pseudogemmobacter hezensis]